MTEVKINKIYIKHPITFDAINKTIRIPLINRHKECIDYTTVDENRFNDIKIFSFHRKEYNGKFYAVSNIKITLHEMIVGKKAPKGFRIDHENGNGLDNRSANLNIRTNGANSQNKGKKEGCSSEYIGVSISQDKWIAKITFQHKQISLGTFMNEIDAGKIYDAHVIHYYGEQGRTNNLLTQEEILDIITNGIPKNYTKKIKDKPEDLPTNIYKYEGRFYTKLIRNGKVYDKYTNTIEKAIEFKETTLQNLKEKDEREEIQRRVNIIRDVAGNAIILIKNAIGKIIDFVVVDDHVWGLVSSYSWNVHGQYYCTSLGIGLPKIDMHRFIYIKFINENIPEGMTVDHKNPSEKKDNRISNLRLADDSVQSHNQRKVSENNFDKYNGVTLVGKHFRAQVGNKYQGNFKTAEEAAVKANEFAKEVFGDCGFQNEIDFEKETTWKNRIPESLMTKKYVEENINSLVDLKNIIQVKKFNIKEGGPINTSKLIFNSSTFKEIKKRVIELL